MALVPVIQPPIMRALTTKAERAIKMGQLRPVSKTEKIIFPIMSIMQVRPDLSSPMPTTRWTMNRWAKKCTSAW